MGGDEHVHVGLQLRHDLGVPIRKDTGHDIFQAFGRGKGGTVDEPVARVIDGVLGARGLDGRRWDVEAASPEVRLLIAVSCGSRLLVETLQCAVVPFVQAPVTLQRQPHLPHFAEREVTGHHCAREDTGVGKVEAQAFVTHHGTRGRRLALTLRGQLDVVPTGEEVEFVPGALAVSEQDQDAGHTVRLEDRQIRAKSRVLTKLE